ncbi:Na+/H+ antiporter subunit G [bacterium]|nr:MAG: Na+/H+ antiporter subunit G [bacterium]
MSDTIAHILISIGVLFDLLGCVGLVRLPDVYNRLQAATKCVTLGTCMILIGVLVLVGFNALGIKAVICMVFVLLTSPTSAHALARGSHKAGVPLWPDSVTDKYKERKGAEK